MNEIKKLSNDKDRAVSRGQNKEAAEACNAIGNLYFNEERYDEALKEYTEELGFCEKTGDQMSIAVANRRIGECYAELKNFKKAFLHVGKFLDIAKSLKFVVEEQRAMATFGRIYFLKYQNECQLDIGDIHSKTLDQAELAYYKALKLSLKLSSEMKPAEFAEMKSRLLLNLGLVYEARGNYEKSFKHVKQGLEIASNFRLDEEIRRCTFNLGTLYHKVNDYHEADKAYDMALTSAKKFHNKNVICEIKLCKAINLIYLEKFEDAKKILKFAYKLHTTNSEDHCEIIKHLKVCFGVSNCEHKLKTSKKYSEKKMLLEKIADGLSSIKCYKPAIKKYLLTLECMEEANSALFEKAPIYFSIAQTYLDDGNVPKALEYFEKEIECNKDKPLEQIETLWKVASILEEEKHTDKLEKVYLQAVSIAEKAENMKSIHYSLNKLFHYYNKTGKNVKAEEVKKKRDGIKYECDSEDENKNEEESHDPFSDVHLSELSDSDDNEERIRPRKRTKKIEDKINEKGETPLHQACINGNFNMVKKLIENRHSVNVRDYCGWTPLHEACNYGFYDIVDYLLENGADINDPGGPQCGGITALHDAACCGNLDVMQLLMDKGASTTVVDKNGETPLHALLQWKKRSAGELDDVTLRQCKAVEEELRLKMTEAGFTVNDIDDISEDASVSSKSPEISSESKRQSGEKRVRSPSMSPDIESSDDEINSLSPYINIEDDKDWDDANNAKAEYKSVMENLRRSAAGLSPVKIRVSETQAQGPSLVNEHEVVDEWLIKDTSEIPKTKRKKRRLARLNVRTSKCIDNYLIPQDTSEKMEAENNNNMVDEDSNCSITSVNSTDKGKEVNPLNVVNRETSKVSFCLRVSIADKLILVPVPDDNCTISWLSEEAAQRFQSLDGSKPHLILTKNGALLAGADLVKNIFSNNEEVHTTVEAWDEPSLDERYVQFCAKRNIVVSSVIKKRFKNSSELNFSNCSIPPAHLNIIFNTLSNFKSLYHLNISNVALNSSINEFIACMPSFSVLVTLNMSCCCLTSQSMKKITGFLNSCTSQNIFPALRSLDLSFNNFSSASLLPILKLESLISLNLSSCSLNSSFLSNESFCQILKNKYNLENLDVSDNNLGDSGISSLLYYLPKMNLKKLNLRHTFQRGIGLGSKLFTFFTGKLPFLTELLLQGCYLTDADVNEIALCLSSCPELHVCDFSANPSLSSDSLCNFFNRAYENYINITDINVTGTCNWYGHSNLSDFLRFKNLKHLCIDNCTEDQSEKLIEFWTNKWGNRAICSNYGFYELSVT